MKTKKEIEAVYKNTGKIIEQLKQRRKTKMRQDLINSYGHIESVLEWVLEK